MEIGDLAPAGEDSGLVFTNEAGRHLVPHTVRRSFKRVAASIGCADTRFHDLRHSYAVAAIKSGDDIKNGAGQSRPCNRRLYSGRLRSRHRADEKRKC